MARSSEKLNSESEPEFEEEEELEEEEEDYCSDEEDEEEAGEECEEISEEGEEDEEGNNEEEEEEEESEVNEEADEVVECDIAEGQGNDACTQDAGGNLSEVSKAPPHEVTPALIHDATREAILMPSLPSSMPTPATFDGNSCSAGSSPAPVLMTPTMSSIPPAATSSSNGWMMHEGLVGFLDFRSTERNALRERKRSRADEAAAVQTLLAAFSRPNPVAHHNSNVIIR